MTKHQIAKEAEAYKRGRNAADEGMCGHSPYEDWRVGFAWIDGYEERMGELGSPAVRIFCWACRELGDHLAERSIPTAGIAREFPL